MTLWTSAQAEAATGGRAIGTWSCDGVSIDTRTIEQGDLFVALKDVRDGHEFVAQALEKGAGAALVSRVPEGVAEDAPLLIVEDVLAGLEALGRAGRARTGAKVAAVTGSVGKTSTKEMLLAMLGDQGRTHASVASYNNHWGVPLTLARMPQDTEYAVIEIGMNHPGEIAPLAKMARPDVAMVTTVAAAHLEAFDNVAQIAVEKAAIFEGVPVGGVAVINADIEHAAILMAKAVDCKLHEIEFGTHGFQFKLKEVSVQADATVVQADADGTPLLFKIATPGRHFAMNGLGALAVVQALGADMALAAQSLGRWTPFQGRGVREVITLDPVETHLTLSLIDDSYNANPTSMAASLEVLAASAVTHDIGRVSKGRRIAFLGDMKELGDDAIALHAGLAHLEATQSLDVVHCVGPLMRSLYDLLPEHQRGDWTETSIEMLTGLRQKLDSGDVVLAKGSLSMKLGAIVDAIRKMGHRTDGM
ncbi:UDP-N-acetylmuramoyl-tripeptide--D-alanyl-D-alanine ligase [Sulfitobacter sp. M57]|uniref:UDP-N-acetylmuramoyl-tripeptide--D-alanyl-D- alanine ligase n=1 Tax=unclassified Sulfitobacter TaxID=196795 RepID=UPI0023E0AEEC|nr:MULTISPECIES: UDP-N-acetylmuramoyl-tripeptide--D-alanyl-D-alanine ligase [unclassified Sulfitobacter]MDF3414132.1 UDP-N-acetylmuramoyl-tripeptide--D-alanyl-D-alanine ligase [Sulfitobacter sp. KE5]MDF3420587.1 UDP-N-acetylmuramoyl-tripeptide--D-alanyl-D-alanine ligase [Sulfitobacter sp. KE43]MDF3432678.1 UDP-N-acetylmuramoyl-tripeptide--D-alanyl-D-alanine ligase [Sulfitobacter sp. KE42]MDF3458317.1 UDP-N-acetylmuramoyl-tripeptide--D-alanyl-D-alanine ligase [Sulfitobacter sp. S74]MDF3462218.1